MVFYILQLICKVQKLFNIAKGLGTSTERWPKVVSDIALLTSRSMNKHAFSTPGSDHTAR